MLVLTSRPGETITAGSAISFTIVSIDGDQVQVCVDAPKDVPVRRREVSARIRAERMDASPDQSTSEAEPEERIVRGIKVKVTYRKLSPAEAAAKRAVLLDVIARSLLKARESTKP